MKQYMEVGERGYYDKKRFRCAVGNFGCEGCSLSIYLGTKKQLCDKLLCKEHERPDGQNVIFCLQPKYWKEVKNG